MNKEEVLGATVPADQAGGKITPFNREATLKSLLEKNDGSIPHYCTKCGITAFLPAEAVQKLFKETVPSELGSFIYIESLGCPHCLDGELGTNPVVKSLN